MFGLGARARTHEFLQRRFYEVVADLAEITSVEDTQLVGREAALNRLYAEEPPPMRALDAVAYNAASDICRAPASSARMGGGSSA